MTPRKLTCDKARIAREFAWQRGQSTTDEQIKVLDTMIERLATSIFGSRSRVQRNEFLRIAKYKQPIQSTVELYERYLRGYVDSYFEEVVN